MCLLLAALGLHCCVWAFSSCSKWGLLFIAVPRLLFVVASLVPGHGLQGTWASVIAARGLSSCGTRAQLLCSTWDLSSLTRNQTCSPNLGSTVSTTGPPGKAPHQWFLKCGSWVSSISITWKLVRHKFSSPAWITESENLGWGSWI